jgi:hypothetical protein
MSTGEGVGTLSDLHGPDHPGTPTTIRNRRVLYLVITAALSTLVALAVLEAAGGPATFGIDTTTARAAGHGYELEVRHATVSRPGLATPFEVVVRRAGGFDQPVTVGVSQSYFGHWDELGFYPTPSAETADREWLLWTFDPPPGDVLRFRYDGRITPALQRGASGRVAVVEDGDPVVEVSIRTRILP